MLRPARRPEGQGKEEKGALMNIHIGDTVEARVSRQGGWFLATVTDIWCFELPWGVRFDVRAPDGLVGGAILPSDIRFPSQQAA